MPASRKSNASPALRKSVKQLVDESRVIFRLCALPNGGIVAARSDLPGYPSDVQNYGLVWVRDAAFVCAAAHRVGLHLIQEPFYEWLLERAEGFSATGELHNNYTPNGVAVGVAPSTLRGNQLIIQSQWDAVGTLLWAITDGTQWGRVSRAARQVAQLAADSIVKNWSGKSFKKPSWDIWEERTAGSGSAHLYSVAMSLAGLKSVDWWLPASRARQQTIRSMRRVVDSAVKQGHFVRTTGRRADATADMSLLGLVFPAEVVNADDVVMKRTLKFALQHCRTGPGYARYPNDKYSGGVRSGKVLRDGAGAWPWLSAWAAIVLHDGGQTVAAHKEFQKVLAWSRRGPLPEQIHSDGRPSVSGLVVSHAFAVIAAERLQAL